MKLCVAIPTYNFGAFLPGALGSILPQAEKLGVGVVVVDGASTDDTEAVVAGFLSPLLRYVKLARKGGIDVDMARAVELVESEFCWLFSADDVMRPGALARVLARLDDDVDVFIGRHTNCTKEMEIVGVHPVLKTSGDRLVDLNDAAGRGAYFQDAVSTEAFFSFMSSLVVRVATWRQAPDTDAFIGSCWAHAARLFAVAVQGPLRVAACDEVWLDKRGENDSFMSRGLVARLAIAIDGFTRIVGHCFGEGSLEMREIRRVLRWEINVPLMLHAKRLTWKDPERESIVELDRLFDQLNIDAPHAALRRAVYGGCPAALGRVAGRGFGAFGALKSAGRRLMTTVR